MGTLYFLAIRQMEAAGEQIRMNLDALQRLKRVLAVAKMRPERNSALDPVLARLEQQRQRLHLHMREIAMRSRLGEAEDQALSSARAIFTDVEDLAELLIWFGAKMPELPKISYEASSVSRSR